MTQHDLDLEERAFEALRARAARARAALGLPTSTVGGKPPAKIGTAGRRSKRAKGKAARAARKRNR